MELLSWNLPNQHSINEGDQKKIWRFLPWSTQFECTWGEEVELHVRRVSCWCIRWGCFSGPKKILQTSQWSNHQDWFEEDKNSTNFQCFRPAYSVDMPRSTYAHASNAKIYSDIRNHDLASWSMSQNTQDDSRKVRTHTHTQKHTYTRMHAQMGTSIGTRQNFPQNKTKTDRKTEILGQCPYPSFYVLPPLQLSYIVQYVMAVPFKVFDRILP